MVPAPNMLPGHSRIPRELPRRIEWAGLSGLFPMDMQARRMMLDLEKNQGQQ
jgi:hypothetical protein